MTSERTKPYKMLRNGEYSYELSDTLISSDF